MNKQWVGRDATKILEQIGITGVDTRLLVCEVDKDHPFVQVEQMMPICRSSAAGIMSRQWSGLWRQNRGTGIRLPSFRRMWTI